MIDRRRFIMTGAAAGVGAMLPVRSAEAAEAIARTSRYDAAAGEAAMAVVGVSPPLSKYTETLLVPTVEGGLAPYAPTGVTPAGVPHYDIPIQAFTQQLHASLPPTPLWGYGGTYPSRSIEAVVGTPIEIRWINNLLPSDAHPLAASIDRVNVDGMRDPAGILWPDQRITTHLHGGHVPWTSDGGPKTWYTGPQFALVNGAYVPGSQVLTGEFPNGDTYYYPNNQNGSTLWFHDHAMGITRYNVLAGMAGFFILRNPLEAQLFNLPSGAFEIPIAIQDRIFNADGTLYYPPAPAVPEFFGDTFVVNGRVWPRLKVEPRKYRFRLLNGCNARFLRMQMVVATVTGTTAALPSVRNWVTQPFTQIGAEGGLLPAPANMPVLLLAPAERADVIVDFSAYAGKQLILYNDAATPFSGTADTRGAIPEVMLFDVSLPLSSQDTSVVPSSFAPLGGLTDPAGNPVPSLVTGAVNIPKVLTEIKLPNGMLMQLINFTGYDRNALTGAPSPAEVSVIGRNEIWQIINTTVDTHPIHLHQTVFQVLDRQKFGVSQYLAKAKGVPIDPTPFVKGAPIPAGPDEQGWKETVKANPGEVTRIAMRFQDYTGNYVYHCHILEHEEHDMMRALTINAVA